MNARLIAAFVTVLLLIGLTSLAIGRSRDYVRLGAPGVKIIPESLVDEDGKPVGTNSVYLPPSVLGATSKTLPITRVEANVLPTDTVFGRRLYEWPDGFTLQVNVVLMGNNRGSFHAAEACLPAQGWRVDESTTESIPIAAPGIAAIPAVRLLLTRTDDADKAAQAGMARGIYTYWFVSDRRVVPATRDHMVTTSLELLRTGQRERWAYVAVIANCRRGDESRTFERVKTFIAALVPQAHASASATNPQAGPNPPN